MPPQLAATRPATASRAAADTRIHASYRGRGSGARGRGYGLQARPRTLGWRRARRVEQAQARDHQAIGLTREGGGENRVPLRVARQFLSEGDEILPLECRLAFELHLGFIMIAQRRAIGNLNYTFSPVTGS